MTNEEAIYLLKHIICVQTDLTDFSDTAQHAEALAKAITALRAQQSADKLIRTMRNNKKAALWIKEYGLPEDAGGKIDE